MNKDNPVLESDTTPNVDATLDKPCKRKSMFNPNDDPLYREYFERIAKLTMEERETFQDKCNPFMGKVIFRYCEGIICKIIWVISPDGTISNIQPCREPLSKVKNRKTTDIRCCPFHHLASDIKDTIDRDDIVNSLGKWRTKDLTPYCKTWEDSVLRAMRKVQGRKK